MKRKHEMADSFPERFIHHISRGKHPGEGNEFLRGHRIVAMRIDTQLIDFGFYIKKLNPLV